MTDTCKECTWWVKSRLKNKDVIFPFVGICTHEDSNHPLRKQKSDIGMYAMEDFSCKRFQQKLYPCGRSG